MFELVNAVVVAAGTLLLVLLGASLFPFFYVSAASSAAALAAAVICLHRQVSLLPRFDIARWRELMRDALPYASATTVAILYPRVGLIAVSAIANAHQTGYYSTAYKVVEVVGGTSGLIASSAFPVFARAGRDDHERLRGAVSQVSDTAFIAGTYVTVSLVVAAPFVIAVLGGSAYAPAVPVLRLQALALLAGFMAATWSYSLLSLRMHGALLRVTLAALLAAIALSAALVPSMGAEGASIASAACEFVAAGGYLVALARGRARMRPSLAAIPRIALAGAVALGALALPLPSIVCWAIATGVYVALLVALKAFPHELVGVLLRRGPRASR
jgi:O-antigen/teichoic acid export membrane protein